MVLELGFGRPSGWEGIHNKTSFIMGNGKRVKFWKDKWCGDTTLRESFPSLCIIALTKDAWVVVVWDLTDEGSH